MRDVALVAEVDQVPTDGGKQSEALFPKFSKMHLTAGCGSVVPEQLVSISLASFQDATEGSGVTNFSCRVLRFAVSHWAKHSFSKDRLSMPDHRSHGGWNCSVVVNGDVRPFCRVAQSDIDTTSADIPSWHTKVDFDSVFTVYVRALYSCV